MKSVISTVSIIAVILLASGCKKNLDPHIYGQLTPDNFPQTEADYQDYTAEVYKPFMATWGYGTPTGFQDDFYGYEYSDVQINDAPTDEIAVFSDWGGIFEFFSKANFDFLKTQDRSSHFEKIRFVTLITKTIGDLEKSSISKATKTELLAEAHCARGFLMYHLLTMYGPLPVILDPSKIGTDAENNLTRLPEADYTSAAAADLRWAADSLPKDQADYGRFNKGLALTALMRLYLFEKNYQGAEGAGREIMALGYSLVPSYTSLFQSATERNSETIYAVSVGTDPNKTNFNAWPWYCHPYGYGGNTKQLASGGWAAAYMATWPFYDSFDPQDQRRQMLIPSYTDKFSGTVYDRTNMRGAIVNKYSDVGEADADFGLSTDIPVARYADVLLMLAEAINQSSGPTAEAQGFVNQVRQRAGIGDLPFSDVADKDAFANAILKERTKEMFFEGLHRVDLIRFGKWQSALQSVGKTAGPALFPIPQYALTGSKGQLTQTPGY